MFLVREMVILQKSKNNTLLEIKDFNASKNWKIIIYAIAT